MTLPKGKGEISGDGGRRAAHVCRLAEIKNRKVKKNDLIHFHGFRYQ